MFPYRITESQRTVLPLHRDQSLHTNLNYKGNTMASSANFSSYFLRFTSDCNHYHYWNLICKNFGIFNFDMTLGSNLPEGPSEQVCYNTNIGPVISFFLLGSRYFKSWTYIYNMEKDNLFNFSFFETILQKFIISFKKYPHKQ